MTDPTSVQGDPHPALSEAGDRDASQQVSLADVVRAHRLVLHRQIDNTAAAVPYLQTKSVWDLIEALWASPEAEFVRMGEALGFVSVLQDQLPPEVRATEEQLGRLYATVLDAWHRNGLGRYHWWFHRDEQRYAERSRRWNIDLIVAAGAQEADLLLRRCARHGWVPHADASVTVLGAEAFRLAPALAPRLGRYHGVELRPGDVGLGRECLAGAGIANAEMLLLEGRTALPACDLFYSVGALQYAPPPMMIDLLGSALGSLRRGGFAYFQIPCQIHGYDFDVERYLAGESRDPSGEIHALRQQDVLALMARHGIVPLEVFPDGGLERFGLSYVFIGRKLLQPEGTAPTPPASA